MIQKNYISIFIYVYTYTYTYRKPMYRCICVQSSVTYNRILDKQVFLWTRSYSSGLRNLYAQCPRASYTSKLSFVFTVSSRQKLGLKRPIMPASYIYMWIVAKNMALHIFCQLSFDNLQQNMGSTIEAWLKHHRDMTKAL